MSEFEGYTDAEREFLNEKVVSGSDVNPIPAIPNAPDISVPQQKSAVPGTFKDRIIGLSKLSGDEIPVAGQHFVVWGSKLLNDIYARPVKRTTHLTEDAYALKMRAIAKKLIDDGVKNPLHRGQDRDDRAEDYARWRYRGYVCEEVRSL